MKIECVNAEKGTSFTIGNIYKCEEYRDDFLNGYSIFDDGEDWYYYSKAFVKRNFLIVSDK